MKVALFSFEYPPDTGYGGIATTTRQIAFMLQQQGHHVEVFAGSSSRTQSQVEENGFWVHRVVAKRRIDFVHAIVPIFQERHRSTNFDVLESPEFGADAAAAIQALPNIPLVVRLHTPTAMVAEHDGRGSWLAQLRVRAGALRRGINPLGDLEHRLAASADGLIAPSWAIGKELIQRWQLKPQRLQHIPNPFIPAQALLDVPIPSSAKFVTFIGRLDVKKGVTDLAAAIPQIVEAFPQAKFRFVGRNGSSPDKNHDMRSYLEHMLEPHLDAIEFTGQISQQELPSVLSDSAVCVFPSRWENFPNVCLEAMSAGRAVVGSSAGGMAEMLSSKEVGRLVPPQSPEKIAAAVIELLKDPDLCSSIGHNARQKVLDEYSPQRIAELQENSYIRAIQQRKSQPKRKPRVLL
jgi:glycogen synthase